MGLPLGDSEKRAINCAQKYQRKHVAQVIVQKKRDSEWGVGAEGVERSRRNVVTRTSEAPSAPKRGPVPASTKARNLRDDTSKRPLVLPGHEAVFGRGVSQRVVGVA